MTRRSWIRNLFARRTPRTIRSASAREPLRLELLESRIAPRVTAVLNPSNAKELDVSLSAANDQALITPSGTNISVSGTGYSAQSFAGVTSLVVLGANTSTQDVPNQSVTFGGSGGTITLVTAPDTDALNVSGVTSVTFTNVTINATSGDIDVKAAETTEAESTGVVGETAPPVSVSLTGAHITADNVKLEASASSTYESEAALGGALLKEFPAAGDVAAYGFAAAIADLEPSATVTVAGSSSVTVNEAGGNVTIGAEVEVKVESSTKVGTTLLGSALNPTDAAIAVSVVDSTAIAHVGGGSTVSAGTGTGILSITSVNTTEVKTEVDGSSAVGGGSAAVTLDNSTSQAYVDGGSHLQGGTVNVLAATTNTAETIAKATATGAGANAAVKNMLAGQVDPAYLDDQLAEKETDAQKKGRVTSPALTAATGGLPLAVSAAVAVDKFTPTTQAYVDSSTVTATNAISIVASSNNNVGTDTDSSTSTANAGVSLAVAVSINDTVDSTTATVENTSGTTTLTAPTILVQAATPTTSAATPNVLNASAKATSGASGTDVGFAGALALNIVSDTSEASVPSGSAVAMIGDVTFDAQDSVTETATAHPPEEEVGGEGGGALGVGASVALNIASNTTLADLQDMAQLTGANNLTFSASSSDTVATNAVAGSKGGALSINPSVGISVVNNTTAAQVGAPDVAHDPLRVGGAFSAIETHTGLASTATGAASGEGETASAGVAIALAFVTDQTTATTGRSMTASGGGVRFEADGSAASLVTANASADGGPTESEEKSEPNSGPADGSKAASGSNTADPNSVDGQNAQQRSYADKQSSTLTDSKGKKAPVHDSGEKRPRRLRPRTGRSPWPPPWQSTSSIARPSRRSPPASPLPPPAPDPHRHQRHRRPQQRDGTLRRHGECLGHRRGDRQGRRWGGGRLEPRQRLDRGDDPVQQQPTHDDQHPWCDD